MTIKYFPVQLQTEQQIRNYYKVLAKTFHPDAPGGDTDIMQQINQEYAWLEKNNFNRTQKQQPHYTPSRTTGINIKAHGKEYSLDSDQDMLQLLSDTAIKILKIKI